MPYSVVLPAALAFFHLSLAIAASLALSDGLTARYFLERTGLVERRLAHLARAAAAIVARPAADIRRFGFEDWIEEVPPRRAASSACRRSISVFIPMAFVSSATVKSFRFRIG